MDIGLVPTNPVTRAGAYSRRNEPVRETLGAQIRRSVHHDFPAERDQHLRRTVLRIVLVGVLPHRFGYVLQVSRKDIWRILVGNELPRTIAPRIDRARKRAWAIDTQCFAASTAGKFGALNRKALRGSAFRRERNGGACRAQKRKCAASHSQYFNMVPSGIVSGAGVPQTLDTVVGDEIGPRAPPIVCSPMSMTSKLSWKVSVEVEQSMRIF